MASPIEAVKAFYAAVAQGDVPGVVNALHPDLTWTEAEGFPYYSGTWNSPQEVVEKLLIPLAKDWNDFSVVADAFVRDGDVVVSFGAYAGVAKVTGKPMRAPFAHRWHVRDGKLAQFDMYTDTWLVREALRV